MSVKPRKRIKKEGPRPRYIVKDINYNDLVEASILAIKQQFNLGTDQLEVKLITPKNHNKYSEGIDISAQFVWKELYEIKLHQKMIKDGVKVNMVKYQFELKPLYEKDDFFRFDFSSEMPLEFPECHINADKIRYGNGIKSHFTYPNDILINLSKVNLLNIGGIFLRYDKTHANPVADRGKKYIGLV